MTRKLKPTLGSLHLWEVAVGRVISGEYFGWRYGWGVAGTVGFLITTALIATLNLLYFQFYPALKYETQGSTLLNLLPAITTPRRARRSNRHALL